MKICDCHNDFLTQNSFAENALYLAKCKELGVLKIVASVFTTSMQEEDAFDKIKTYKKFLKQTFLKPKTLLHIEDCFFVRNPVCLAELINIKPFSCGLTWNGENCLAGGCQSENGLSSWGKQVVKSLFKNNIIIDLAHLNNKSFFDIARLVRKPLFCSHTAFFEVNKHERNLTKNQVKLICESGGIIGLSFVNQFLNSSKIATVNDVCKHIFWFLDNFNENCLCVGSDFFGSDNLPINLKKYSNFNNLKNELILNKVPIKIIDKIMFKNFESYCNKLT